MGNDSFLCVYILAYENASCVKQLVDSAIESLPSDTLIVIADNSDRTDEVKKVYEAYISVLNNQVTYFRHDINNGSIVSILKGFELVQSKYLWIVGACNRFNPFSIQLTTNILKESNPDALMIFENNLWRKQHIHQPILYTNYLSLISDHSYSVICSINSTIYNLNKFRPLLHAGYQAMSSLVPHTAMIIEGLRTQKISVLYAPLYAIDRPVRERVWSTRKFLRHITSIFPGYVHDSEINEFLQLLSQTDTWIHNETARMSNDPDYGYEIKHKNISETLQP